MYDAISSTEPGTGRTDSLQQNTTNQTFLIICSVLITALTVLLLLGLCLVQLFVVPRFIEVFQDFDTQLPSLTIRLISIPTTIYLAVYGLGIVGLIAKDCIPQLHVGIKIALNLIVILLCIVMYFAYLYGLYLPMITMMESMM